MRLIREIRANLGPPGGSGAVLFDPDGKSVVAAPHFGRVAFPSGEVLAKGAPSMEVDSISDDGSTLYTHPRGYRPYVRLWDARKLQPAGEDLRTGSERLRKPHGLPLPPLRSRHAAACSVGFDVLQSISVLGSVIICCMERPCARLVE